jgi:DNA polymerase-4
MKFHDFEIITRSRSAPVAVSSRSDLEGFAISLLNGEMPAQKPVRLQGLALSSPLEVDGKEPQLDLPI